MIGFSVKRCLSQKLVNSKRYVFVCMHTLIFHMGVHALLSSQRLGSCSCSGFEQILLQYVVGYVSLFLNCL